LRLPRDISGAKLASSLARFGYKVTRQTGSHLRLTSNSKGSEHHITIPLHSDLKVGTLSSIVSDVVEYLEIDRETLLKELK
jgi:predicted RNA binding protein YcfA (HicA-like mRNA interferase family)